LVTSFADEEEDDDELDAVSVVPHGCSPGPAIQPLNASAASPALLTIRVFFIVITLRNMFLPRFTWFWP
jgi:hypothetical protein